MTIDKQALREAAERAKDNFIPNFRAPTQDVLALLDELEAADALNKHLELAIRKAESCSEVLRRKAEAAEKRNAELERSETKLIDERDNAESALNDAYKAVMGQAPEWSNWFSFENAIDEIELVCELWRNQTDDVIQFRQRIAEDFSMTTITKEQAQKIIDAADEVITALAGTNDDVHPDNSTKMTQLYDDLNDHYAPPEVVRELARIALAALEVAPVGEVSEKRHGLVMDGTVDLGGESTYRIIKGEKAMKRLPLGTKFYIAPPVPVVPEEITDESTEQRLMGRRWAHSFCAGWNACRAAMLQSKYRDLSQPVDPQISEYEQIMLQAGWVMVPIEPTDEMIAAAMECDDVVFDSKDPTAFCVQYREIYCAMVDVAPQPEGNNR